MHLHVTGERTVVEIRVVELTRMKWRPQIRMDTGRLFLTQSRVAGLSQSVPGNPRSAISLDTLTNCSKVCADLRNGATTVEFIVRRTDQVLAVSSLGTDGVAVRIVNIVNLFKDSADYSDAIRYQ